MDKPFIFYGKSYGALLAYLLSKKLEESNLTLPRSLFIHDTTNIISTSGVFELEHECSFAEESLSIWKQFTSLAYNVSFKSRNSIILLETDQTLNELWRWQQHEEISSIKISTSGCNGNEKDFFEAEILQVLNNRLKEDVERSIKESVTLIDQWNSETFKYPENSCLHDLFIESAAIFPDEIAVVYHNYKMTFSELDKVTDDLANWLYCLGCREGSVVGIFMEHCIGYAIAYIAAHKAGGAYMPIEVVYPEDLLKRVFAEAKPVCVLTSKKYESSLPPSQCKLVIDDSDETWKINATTFPKRPLDRELPTPDSLAYMVMSSGTTGVPKGICCPHRGAVHSYYYRLVKYPYAKGDREACNVFFVWEMLRPLLGCLPEAGGVPVPLYVIPDNVIYDPTKLMDFLSKNLITRILFTPSLLQLIFDTCSIDELKDGFKTMRIIWFCGEVVTVELRDKVAATLPHIQLENLYSISECHDISYANLNRLNTSESPKFAPCGRVIPNVGALIYDDNMNQVPIGVPGRMFIDGPCLALGYLNMPEKTAERFVPNPKRSGKLMYDTGDRCRFLPSGSIEVIGRCDYMIKIRGYSVVIGAVEAAISEHPLVSTACVLAEGDEGSVDKKLVAYVVPEQWDHIPTISSIQHFVKSKLPPYAIPSVFLLLDAIPINMASGKLDRKRLPKSVDKGVKQMPVTEMLSTAQPSGAFVEPQIEYEPSLKYSKMERLLSQIWSNILNLDISNVKRESQFYDLGGHSLLLIKVATEIKKAISLEIPLPELVETTTLSSLASLLEEKMCSDGKEEDDPSAPFQSETVKQLAEIWAETLQCSVEKVESGSNFFDLGGHSLLLIKVASSIKRKLDVEVELSKIIECTSLKSLAELVSKKLGGKTAPDSDCIDLAAEASNLDPSIYPATSRKAVYSRFRLIANMIPPARVLLTGSTGFLGAHILFHSLMETKVMAIYCLVRAKNEDEVYCRIEATLRQLDLWNDSLEASFRHRVVAVPGDLSRPLLGLSLQTFKSLAGELDAIVHAGAQVNLVVPYQNLKPTNVLGTQEILRLAVTNGIATRVKAVHYISTNGVFPIGKDSSKIHRENDDLSHAWKDLMDGYAQSKWVSERLCLEVRNRGLPLSILRCGNLAPSSSTGVWNGSDFIYLILKACVEMKCAPDESSNWKIDMTPVDYAARAIVQCSIVDPTIVLDRNFHVQNPNPHVPFEQYIRWMEESMKISLERINVSKFRTLLFAAADQSPTLAQAAMGFDSFNEYLQFLGDFGGEKLVAALSEADVKCPRVDSALVAKYSKRISAH